MFVHRVIPQEEVRLAAIEAFKQTVTSELEGRIAAKKQIVRQVAILHEQQNASIKAEPASRSALKALAPMLEEERTRFKSVKTALKPGGPNHFSITTNGSLTVGVPPYDVRWTSGLFDDADANAGTFVARSIDSLGYQAAGIGVFVNSTIEQEIRFSADAQFHSRWTDLVLEGAATSEGGLGVLVYEGGNVVARNDATLWSDFQSGTTWHGQSGDDSTFLTQTAAGQTYFHMLPGRQYLVWVWCWLTTDILGSALAVASIEAQMPFIVVERQRG